MLKKTKIVTQLLKFLKNFLLKLVSKIEIYEKSRREKNHPNGLLFISFQVDGVYLNDVKVIDKRATFQILILKMLLEQHLLSRIYLFSNGLNVLKMSDILCSKGISSFDQEKHIRQSIYKIKQNISKKYGSEIGENFIQQSKKSGQYKLAENIVLIRSKMACGDTN